MPDPDISQHTVDEPGKTPEFGDFDALVDAHASVMVAYARRNLRDPRLAEDVVQETFLAAWRSRAPFEGRSAVRTWLFGILRRKVIDAIRKQSRQQTVEDRDQTIETLFEDDHYRSAILSWGETPEGDFERQEFWKSFRTCLEGLPMKLAQTFALREIDGLDRKEICRVLGISSSNYWVMLHRARMKLRDCVQSGWYGPSAEESP